MAITVFARIRREHLREMYLSYCYTGRQGGDGACSDKVLGLVALYARAALLDLVAETRTEDFFRERVRIIEAMTGVVREAVAPLHMEIFMLNLREVVFDEEVGAAVLRLGLPRTPPPPRGPVGALLRTERTHSLTPSPQVDEAITSKIVTAQSIETKLLEQQTRQVRNHQYSLVTHDSLPSTITTNNLRVTSCYSPQVLADKAVLIAQADTEIAWRLAAARAQGSIVEAGAESDAFLVEVSKYPSLVRSKWRAPGGGAP
jgi:hypothetical protein